LVLGDEVVGAPAFVHLVGEHVPETATEISDNNRDDEEPEDLVAVHKSVLDHDPLFLRVVLEETLEQLVEPVDVDQLHQAGQPEHTDHLGGQHVGGEEDLEREDSDEINEERASEGVLFGYFGDLPDILIGFCVSVLDKELDQDVDTEEDLYHGVPNQDPSVVCLAESNVVDGGEAGVANQEVDPHVESRFVL
jgi:hypothetical protein